VPRRHWSRSTLAQALLAFSFNIIGLFAGSLLNIYTPLFKTALWILILFPPILTVRGDISGILSGNLSTMLHTGQVGPRIRGNTRPFYSLVSGIFVLTFIDTLGMGVLSLTMNLISGRVSPDQFYIFAVVPTTACTMTVILAIPLTSLIAFSCFKRGLNPDILVYPILSSLNDILVTISYVITVSLILSSGLHYIPGIIFLFVMLFSLYLIWRNRGVELFVLTLREGVPLVLLSSLFGTYNGTMLATIAERFLSYPGLIILYPALMSTLGDIGSTIGSLTTTRLALGYLRTFKEVIRESLNKVLHIEVAAAFIHIVFGFITYLIVVSESLYVSLPFLIGVALLSNLSSFLIASLLSSIIAYSAFKRGWNPDNFVIPFITSVSDTVATLSLLPATAILRIIG